MSGQYQITHEKLLKGFLGAVLLFAGLIAGIRFAPGNAPVEENTTIIEEAPTGNIDISGEWIGTTTEDYGDEARYDYRIVFDQDGHELSGILYLTRNHRHTIYTETRFNGTIYGNDVFYASEKILVVENADLSDLCLVETTVRYDVVDGQEVLIGTWVGREGQQPGCDSIDGAVFLTRQPE